MLFRLLKTAISFCAVIGLAACQSVPSADGAHTRAANPRPANVVVILADDLGYGDISTYGGRVQTPNIDRIASAGVTFTQGYVTTPVCSPSRAALLTGRYQQRFGFEYNARISREWPGVGLIPQEQTLARHLQGAGYTTGMVGKWHLGFLDEHYPTNRGFDEFFGHLSGASDFINTNARGAVSLSQHAAQRMRHAGDTRTDLVKRGAQHPTPPEQRRPRWILRGAERQVVPVADYLTDVLAREAEQFINRHADDPFFLYLSFNAPHSPFQVTEAYYNRFPDVENELQRIYFGMIAAMDDGIGRVLDALEAQGVADNTLVIFLSDNGCAAYFQGLCSCEPFSGGKLTYYEGGVRVPFVARWPGVIEPGQRSNVPVSALDVVPTALRAAGHTPPASAAPLDGHSLVDLLQGRSRHERFVWRNYPTVAVRRGNLKLIKPNQDKAGGYLYNVADDPKEQRNLAPERPEDVRALESDIRDWAGEMAPPLWGRRPPVTYSVCNIEPIGFEN